MFSSVYKFRHLASLILVLSWYSLSSSAQYRVTRSGESVDLAHLTDGIYIIQATSAGETGYIYNATKVTGENFRISNASHPSAYETGDVVETRYAWRLSWNDDGTFVLQNLSTGLFLPADNTRNNNCSQNNGVIAHLQLEEDGSIWQTNYDYEGEPLYLHTNYRYDDRCLSYWNDANDPGTGTALQVAFYPCDVELVFDVNTTNGTFYRQNRYSESTETENSVYKYVSSGSAPQLTITAEGALNNIDIPAFNWFSGKSLSQTYTLSISEGYRITGYDITFDNGDAAVPMTITPAEGGFAVTAEGEESAFLSVSDLMNTATSFTITANEHKPAHISSFLVYYTEPHIATFELWANDSIVKKAYATAFEGEALTLPTEFTDIPYAVLTWDQPIIMRGEDSHIRVDYAWDGPFEIGDNYFLSIGDSIDTDGTVSAWGPMSYIDAANYDGLRFELALCETNGSPTGVGYPQHLNQASGIWIFSGSYFTGFQIQNALNHRFLAAEEVTPGNDTGKRIVVRLVNAAELEANHLISRWDIAPATSTHIDGGFYLRQHGTAYSLNERQDGSRFFLSFWTSGESTGSTLRVWNTLPERTPLRVSGVGYTTSCYPFATAIPEGKDLVAYTVTLAADGNSVELNEVADGIIPAYEPVLLVGTEASPLVLATTAQAEGRMPFAENILTGTLDTLYIDENERNDYLVLTWLLRTGFYTSSTLTNIPANTAYIDNSLLHIARGLPIGEITAIEQIERDASITVQPIYDLQGRRVERPQHGIYIVNGQKVLVP